MTMKWYMACRTMPFAMTLSDRQSDLPTAGLLSNECFRTVVQYAFDKITIPLR